MTIDQEIAELRAELSGSIQTRADRAEIETALERATHRRDRLENEAELMMLAALEHEDADGYGIDPQFDDVEPARELAFA